MDYQNWKPVVILLSAERAEVCKVELEYTSSDMTNLRKFTAILMQGIKVEL